MTDTDPDIPPAPPSSTLTLIGMPGAGKSTVGVLLAKATARRFVDTDLLLQAEEGRTLQAVLDMHGVEAFLLREEALLLALPPGHQVVATGGSAVYSVPAMERLRRLGPVIALDLPLDALRARLGDAATRGIALRPGETLESLYEERAPLYRRYADLSVNVASKTPAEVVDAVLAALEEVKTLRDN